MCSPSAHAALPPPARGFACRMPLTLFSAPGQAQGGKFAALGHRSFLGLLAGLVYLSAAKPLSTGRECRHPAEAKEGKVGGPGEAAQ